MNSEIINKLSKIEHEGLIITQYASSELYKDESGNDCVIIRGLMLKPLPAMSDVIDHVYCDTATIVFKKDDAV